MKKFFQNILVGSLALLFALGVNVPLIALAAGPATVNLLTAGNFSILSKSGITNTGSHASAITGDIGSSPITAAAMDNIFCSEITGTIYGTNAAYVGSGSQTCFAGNPPLSNKTLVDNAVADMESAYTDAAGRTLPDGVELYAGNIGGKTFAPGLYKWSTDVNIATNVTLSGSATDIWIFQIAGNLNLASGGSVPSGIKVLLAGGAKASNIFWQVGGVTGATLGTYSTFNGNILAAKQIIMQTGAVFNGRALAQTQVTLDANNVSPTNISALATLHVIKQVVNNNGGTATSSFFTLHVKSSGSDVAGSPATGAAAPGIAYSLPTGVYVVSENSSSYTQSFSGDCDASGSVTLAWGANKTCTLTNTDVPAPVITGGGGGGIAPTLPVIGISKVPSPLILLSTGQVTYNYTVWNAGGQVSLVNIKVSDDKCSPVVFLSGDLNNNFKIDQGENWKYSCTATLANTTTNTATATGYSDDPYHQMTTAVAVVKVLVGASSQVPITNVATTTPIYTIPTNSPLADPLIKIIKVPSRLKPFPFGGGQVKYTYTVTNPGTVALENVTVSDDKCGPVSFSAGDINENGLLDSGEKWLYSCQAKIIVSTKNIATAEGQANGLTASSQASATVLVAVPGLPNTGLSPLKEGTPWSLVILSISLIAASASLIIVLKKESN